MAARTETRKPRKSRKPEAVTTTALRYATREAKKPESDFGPEPALYRAFLAGVKHVVTKTRENVAKEGGPEHNSYYAITDVLDRFDLEMAPSKEKNKPQPLPCGGVCTAIATGHCLCEDK
jgi:hypothetical protein